MRRIFILLVLVLLFYGCNKQEIEDNKGENIMHEYKINENVTLYWLGHSSFKVKAPNITIYIDPYDLKEPEKADFVLITHPHYDHFSITDLEKISTNNTIVAAPYDAAQKLSQSKISGKLIPILPGEKKTVNGVKIEAIPAYNNDKEFHPKQNNWVGYVIEVSGARIYHAGDTDKIYEMEKVKADVALLPVGGTYTMDAKDAAEACGLIKPKVAIPMHYNKIVGTSESAQEFKRLAGCKVEII